MSPQEGLPGTRTGTGITRGVTPPHLLLGGRVRPSAVGGSRSKLSGSVSGSMERAAGSEGGGLWDRRVSDAHGCTPLPMEDGVFDPLTVGGLARRVAAVCSLESGDVAVRTLNPRSHFNVFTSVHSSYCLGLVRG